MLKFSKLSLLFLGLSLVLLSCGDDDDKKKTLKNQIKVDGKSFDFTKGYIVSEQVRNDEDVVVGSAHWIYLTGGDLEMEDNLVMTGEGPFLAMYIGSDDNNDLIAGEYEMEFDEYDFGNVIYFDLYENFSLGIEDENVVELYDAWYSGDTDGTITVAKSGDKHTFKVNLDDYYYMGSSDNEEEDEVLEKVTGYFSGELEELTIEEEGPAKMSSMLRKAKRIK
jgi:hypothetical protein